MHEQIITEITNRLVLLYHPTEIYLFGSHAWGQPNSDSDVDFLIVIDEQIADRYQALTAGHKALRGINIAKDLLLVNSTEFDQYSQDPRRIFHKIKHEGKKIYARA